LPQRTTAEKKEQSFTRRKAVAVQFDVQDKESCVKMLTVDVSAEELGQKFSETLREVRRIAQIPGFRPGRAPVELLRKKFGSHIVTQVFEDLVKDAVDQAMKEHDWVLAGPVKLENEKETGVPEEGKDFHFTLLVEISPQIELPEYTGIELKAMPTDPTEEEIDNAVQELREQSARFEDIEGRPVQSGDMVVVSYTSARPDGSSFEELTGGVGRLATAKDLWVSIEENSPELVPGMKAKLEGMQIGDKAELNVTFPEDFPIESMRGLEAVYEITVVGIKEKKLPEVNDEWAETLRMSSVQALRDAIASEMMIRKENEREQRLKEQALNFLLEKSVFEIPPSVLEDETRIAVYDLIDRSRRQGADDDFIREKKDDLVKAATQNAVFRARRQYILGEIAKRENIDLDQDELEQFVSDLAAQEKTPVRKLYQKMSQDGRIERVREYLLSQKALEFVLSNASVSEEMPSD
jgi:trigger factor